MIRISHYCPSCRFFYFHLNRCRAFPEGIPEDIRYGDIGHEKPYPGDHGVRYRSREELEARKDQVQCFRCSRYFINLKCEAFLDGIPDEIIDGQVDHTEPYPGDDGLQFEPAETVRKGW